MKSPCKRVKTPAKPQSEVNALQFEDFQRIIENLPKYEDNRARLFVRLVLNTGIREAEAAGLEWRDIDFDNQQISIKRTSQYIPGKGMVETTPKSMTSTRTIPISNTLDAELREYKKWQDNQIKSIEDLYEGQYGDRTRLFTTWTGAPIYDSTLRDWLRKFLAWCEVPHVTVHGLRHTFASVLTAEGVDPRTTAALLGHSSPSLVMNVYANPQEAAKKLAMTRLNRHFNPEQL